MKFNALLMCAVLLVVAGITNSKPTNSNEAILTRYESRDPYGQYALQYLGDRGTLVRSQGALKRAGQALVLVQNGSYRYRSPEGVPVEVNYTADELGYRAVVKNPPL